VKFKISLSEKVLLGIGSLVVLALAETLYISHTMLLGSFARLEKQELRTDVEHAKRSIEGELENLTSICGDWAPWDDTRNFMLGQAPDYNSGNLTVKCLANLNLNFMIFIDTSDRIFHITAIDIEKGVFVQPSPLLINRILADKSLLGLKNPAECKSGLIILPDKISLVAAQPISNSKTEGPISGTLIIGRFLNDNLTKTISEKTRLNISMAHNDGRTKTPDFVQADAELSKDNNIVVLMLDEDNSAGYTNIYDIDGNKYITLKVNVPREIYNRGLQTVHYFMMAMVLTVVIMLATLLVVMQKIVLRPINRLTKNFINIGSNYGGSTKLYTERGDEIGSLARSFDLVMKNLRRKMADLNESQTRFEEVAENSGDWIWEVNAEGLYTYSSPVVEKILGYKPEEVVGKKCFYDLFAPNHKDEISKAAFETFARREKFSGFVNPHIHKNGSSITLETCSTPIVDDDGNLRGYRGVGRDITERTRAEQRLIAVNSLQKLLLPPAPIEQKLKFVTDAVVQLLDADFARVWTISPGDRCDAGCIHADDKDGPHVCRFRDKCLHLMASSGRYTHLDGKVHRRVPFGCYKIGLIAAGQQDRFLTNEAATDPRVHNHDWVKEMGLVSFAGYRLTHTDGTPLGVLALFSKHPISPEEDAILAGIAHSTSMIIHTSRIEEETEKSRKVFQDMIDAMPFGVIVIGKDKKIRQANNAAQHTSGYSKEELVGQLCHKTLCPAEENACPILDLNQKLDRSEKLLIAKDGRRIPIFKSAVQLRLGDENVLLEAFMDITDRKRMENTLRKNEEFTRSVIESSSDCIKVLDLQGNLLSMSGGGQKLLEIDDITPYLNCSFIDYWKGKEKEDCIEAISKAKRGETGVFYGYFETAKGKPKWWEVIVTPIKDVDGSISRLLAISRDITERKKAEKSLEKLNRDLKSTIVLLTQSNRQLREFAYSAAHDLKTPLRGINILAQWLASDYTDKLDDKGQQLISLLTRNVDRINKLINAILQYSTISRERHREHPVDFNTLLGKILVDIKPPPNIKITINKNLPTVVCRETHLRQVLWHLLTNAIKFMDKPDGRIAIDYTDKNDLWEFKISDNGPGIAPQHFERIFRLFQTLSEQDRSEGSGIGLTIVRKIVELYGGQVWLTSELGQGSTFFFTLTKATPVTNDEKLSSADSSRTASELS
jgi:two-component system, LuxR family, sensor kinase FixL